MSLKFCQPLDLFAQGEDSNPLIISGASQMAVAKDDVGNEDGQPPAQSQCYYRKGSCIQWRAIQTALLAVYEVN